MIFIILVSLIMESWSFSYICKRKRLLKCYSSQSSILIM